MNDGTALAAFLTAVVIVLLVALCRKNNRPGRRVSDPNIPLGPPPLVVNHTDQWFRNATPAALAHFFENRTPLKDVYVFRLETRGNRGYMVHGHFLHNGYIRVDFKGSTTADHGTGRALDILNNKLAGVIKAAPQWNY